MTLFSKAVILLLGIIALVNKVRAFEIVHKSIGPSNTPLHVGSTVTLSCQSDSYFEYCIWRHKDGVCNFEWKSKHNAVKMQTCTVLSTRVRFVGNYDSHECKIQLINAQMSDSGKWKCEMESYVWGLTRGYIKKDYLDLQIVPATEKSNDEQQEKKYNEQGTAGTPTIVIALSCVGIILFLGIVVFVWVYTRKWKAQNDIDPQCCSSQDLNQVITMHRV